jgi:putative hydrolase of the HAD superfamily
VLDLFGTLVNAPSAAERRSALHGIARAVDAGYHLVDAVFAETWTARHAGLLPTLDDLAGYLAQRCGRPGASQRLAGLRLSQAAERLQAAAGVVATLTQLRAGHVRVCVLSDASADIAAAWATSPLARLTDAAVFSCRAGAVKPDPSLYRLALQELRARPQRTLYCGDGGGDELRGAEQAGLTALRVERRGGQNALAFGGRAWAGPSLAAVEDLPAVLAEAAR